MNIDLSIAQLAEIATDTKRYTYEESRGYHRKEICVDFKIENDDATYSLTAANVLHETGIRNIYYEILVLEHSDEDNLGPVWRDIDCFYTNDVPPLVQSILNHPSVKLFYDWLKINKSPK